MVRKKIVELHDCNVGHSCSWNSWEATQNRNRVSHVSLYKPQSHVPTDKSFGPITLTPFCFQDSKAILLSIYSQVKVYRSLLCFYS